VPSNQSGHEKTITAILPQLVGASNIYGCGMLELGMSFSKEQLVIDNDIIGMMKYAKQGIEVTPKTLGYESIRDVGIGNNFIGIPDTMANIDLPSHPEVFDRNMYDSWVGQGSKSDVDLAAERVKDILANYQCDPIAHRDLVDAVIKKADDRFHHKI